MIPAALAADVERAAAHRRRLSASSPTAAAIRSARLLRERYGYRRRAARDRRRPARPALLPCASAASTRSRSATTRDAARRACARSDDFSDGYHVTDAQRSRGSVAATAHAPGDDVGAGATTARHRIDDAAALLARHRRAHAPAVLASELRRRGHGADRPDRAARAADRHVHARHRPPAGGDARADRSRARASTASPIDVLLPGRRAHRVVRAHERRQRVLRQRRAAQSCCAIRKTRAAARARWPARARGSPGLRRAQSVTRSELASRSSTPRTALPKFNPLADWSDDDVWALHPRARTFRTTRCTIAAIASIGCAPCTRADRARRGRARGPLVVGEPGAQGMRPAPAPDPTVVRSAAVNRTDRVMTTPLHATTALLAAPRRSANASRRADARPSRLARIGGDPHPARSRRAMPQPCPALLRRQGFAGAAAARRKGVPPGRFPFPLLHIDTGHNFPEVIAFRDQRAAELGERLIVRSVEDSIARGTRRAAATPDESRNAHQSVTLLDAIAEFGFDACIGGARRDEEKARAKERVFSFRDAFGQWDPEEPAPRAVEPLQRARPQRASTCACSRSATGPSSTCGSTSRASASTCRRSTSRIARAVVRRGRRWSPVTPLTPPRDGETRRDGVGALSHGRRHHLHGAGRVRCRDRRARSSPRPPATTITERGATRLDDQTNDASMELRKSEGYF